MHIILGKHIIPCMHSIGLFFENVKKESKVKKEWLAGRKRGIL